MVMQSRHKLALGVVASICFLLIGFFAVRETRKPPLPSTVEVAPDLSELPDRPPFSEISTGISEFIPAAENDESAESIVSENRLAESLRKLNDNPGVVPGELLLRLRNASDIAALRSRAPALGIRVLWSDARLNAARIAFTDADLLADELQSNQDVYEDIGPNFLMGIPGLPAEPELEIDGENPGGVVPFRDSWLESIGANQDRSQWGEGVTVAILDSGIKNHPALANANVTQIDLSTSREIHGHGTAMASLVAGQGAPAEGVAPAASLLDLRVADETGMTNTGLVAQAVIQAADRRADVINISLGSFGNSPTLQAAIEYALERNIIIVAAAGNEQTTSLAFPAAYEGVISVGAVDAENAQAYFSNSGETLTISAPGVGNHLRLRRWTIRSRQWHFSGNCHHEWSRCRPPEPRLQGGRYHSSSERKCSSDRSSAGANRCRGDTDSLICSISRSRSMLRWSIHQRHPPSLP